LTVGRVAHQSGLRRILAEIGVVGRSDATREGARAFRCGLEELDADGVRAIALCPGFVDTPMAQWSGIEPAEMIRPEDCAEVVRMCLRLSPTARVPQVVIERMRSRSGDVS